MNLYLLRHASAGQRKSNPAADRKRSLDKEGKQQCIQLGRSLSSLKLNFDSIVSSPLKRAVQTAVLVGTETGYEKKIVLAPALAPEGTWADFQHLLQSLKPHEDVLLVGHNPSLPQLLTRLVSPGLADPIFRLRKAALVSLDLERGDAKVNWILEPRLVRAIQSSVTKSSRSKTSRK